MPKNVREYHRFLTIGEKISNPTKMIVGSFSVYSLTQHEKSSITKCEENIDGFDFFYGSKRNQFWTWYKRYFDSNIILKDKQAIIRSLEINNVAITDVIKSCERKQFSALDKSLSKVEWNREGIFNLFNLGANKVVCTSKWVLQKIEKEILMEGGFVCCQNETELFQLEIFHPIPNYIVPKNSICKVYSKNQLKVYLTCLPSPGGNTYRRLDMYGYHNDSPLRNSEFLDYYVDSVFRWFAK